MSSGLITVACNEADCSHSLAASAASAVHIPLKRRTTLSNHFRSQAGRGGHQHVRNFVDSVVRHKIVTVLDELLYKFPEIRF